MSLARRSLPLCGWIGIALLVASEALLLLGVRAVATWFTPLMWTGYILAIDAVVYQRRGASWLTARRRELPLLVLLSVGVWVLFEAYNFHLKNWAYLNVPENPWVRFAAFFWSFATIMPGVFETADLIGTFQSVRCQPAASDPPRSAGLAICFTLGLALVTIPLAVPTKAAAYLFAAVWIGFILLLEPLLELLGIRSAVGEWRRGNRRQATALLMAGFVCGLLWEAWNYQAYQHQGAYWVYTIPQALRVLGLHYGQMPALGLGGFPPFALELHAFYLTLKTLLGADRVFGGPLGER
jgi:hypothetical protein